MHANAIPKGPIMRTVGDTLQISHDAGTTWRTAKPWELPGKPDEWLPSLRTCERRLDGMREFSIAMMAMR